MTEEKKALYDKIKELGYIESELSSLKESMEKMVTENQEKTELAPGFAYYAPEIEAKRKKIFTEFDPVERHILNICNELTAIFISMD